MRLFFVIPLLLSSTVTSQQIWDIVSSNLVPQYYWQLTGCSVANDLGPIETFHVFETLLAHKLRLAERDW